MCTGSNHTEQITSESSIRSRFRGMSQYVGDFHTEQGHEVEHYGFLDVPIALKGDHSIIGSVIAVSVSS